MEVLMSRLSEISFEPLEPYDGKLSCTVLRGGEGAAMPPTYPIQQLNAVPHQTITNLQEIW